ncbi:MAG: saccharopine dehydrogenase family protein [Brevinematales bacterium]|nr:saccharopine dehydrogenase family protein [Brevinematales bacterium]
MARVMIIGAGGVGQVVAHKCAQVPEVFHDILLASRTKSKCDKIAARIQEKYGRKIQTASLDADKPKNTIKLIKKFRPDMVINVALPYQDLPIMDACLATKTHYLDTANYEPKDVAKFEYKWQWAYHERFKEAGIMAVLGCGFDPGMTNIYTAYMKKHYFKKMKYVDIVDCNAGDHGKAFATNFNPEINIREITQNGRYYENGEWKEIPPMSVHKPIDYPGVGPRESYLLFHEELESLVKNFPEIERIRFWMTFSENYLTHLRVLQNVGLTSITPIVFQGKKIVPLEFLKALLPEPASLGENYKGKTVIGVQIEGEGYSGTTERRFIYNICDHAESYKETGTQAVAYTTGVPAMVGAMMVLTGVWKGAGVFNVEEFDPDPFMEKIGQYGLPWQESTF